MKKDKVEVVFILDKSGSMSGKENDTIGGFNSMLKKQQQLEGECRITTVLFDDGYELLHDRLDLQAVAPITDEEYFVGGGTALLDAMGKTIHKISRVQAKSIKGESAERVLFVIITDGEENSSREYKFSKIKAMVEKHQKEHNWEFMFLGADIDVFSTASSVGISSKCAHSFCKNDISETLTSLVDNKVRKFREKK